MRVMTGGETSSATGLGAMGVKREDLDMLTEMALEDPSCGGNPIPMTRENTRALYEAAL